MLNVIVTPDVWGTNKAQEAGISGDQAGPYLGHRLSESTVVGMLIAVYLHVGVFLAGRTEYLGAEAH